MKKLMEKRGRAMEELLNEHVSRANTGEEETQRLREEIGQLAVEAQQVAGHREEQDEGGSSV